MSHGYSEEDLAALSDEERAAVEADVDELELTATATPVDVDEDPEGDEPAGDPAPVDDDPPGDDPKPVEGDDPLADEPAGDDPPVKDDDQALEPKPEALPADEDDEPEAAKQINPHEFSDDAKGKLTDLRDQLSAGDLSQADYDEQADTIKADDYRERVQAQANDNWFKEVNRFLSSEDNKDYGPEGNPVKFAALDGEVRRLGGNGENGGLTARQILNKAKENVEKAFGGGKQDDPPPKKDDEPAPKPAAQRPTEPNLGDVPAAEVDNPRANTSEFANLDKLGGADLETAIEKMSPEQQERYLAGR